MMRPSYGFGTPERQDHHVSFAQTPAHRGAGVPLDGTGKDASAERLPNFILSSGYTPPARPVLEAGGSPAKDGGALGLLSPGASRAQGTSPSPGATSFNERLRSKTRPSEATPGGAPFTTEALKSSQRHEVFMPQHSLLDDVPANDPLVQVSASRSLQTPAATPTGGLFAPSDPTYGGGGGTGLFDMQTGPGSAGSNQYHTPSQSRFAMSPDGSMPTPGADAGGHWITAFGFAPSMQSLVLREFRNHGEIVRHVSGKGNWMHIMFRTQMQAQVALSRRVRMIGGETMVGVMEYATGSPARDGAMSADRVNMSLSSPGVRSPAMQQTPEARRVSPYPVGASQSAVRTPKPKTSFWDSSFLSRWQ